MNLYQTLIDTARTWPDKVAIQDEMGSLTYQQVLLQTEALKLQLIHAGVIPDSGIALITKNNRHFIIGLYAGIGCGAVVMPIAPQQQDIEINTAIDESRIHFILSDEDCFASFGKEKITLANSFIVSRTELNLAEVTVPFVDAVAFMRYTSGTTGQAKCVILSHQAVYERTEAANASLQISNADTVVWVLPMAYHFVVSIVLYIRYGATITICNSFLAEDLINTIQRDKGTFLYASPMHIRLLAAHSDEVNLPSLRKVISTTTAVNPDHCKTFHQKYKLPVSQAFGIIEIGLPIINNEQASEHPNAVGKALPAYTVAILDEEFIPLPDGTAGLLAIKGPGMFDGYLSPPTTRAQVLQNNWFLTSDYATRNAEGLIEITGRKKSMISVSGNKVFAEEVEAVVNTFPGITQSKAYAKKHILFGEVVVIDIVVNGTTTFDEDALLQHCRKLLSGFKVPQYVNLVSAIEMTGSGKVKR